MLFSLYMAAGKLQVTVLSEGKKDGQCFHVYSRSLFC